MDKFKDFKMFMENQKNASIKILCTDRGGEYLSSTFKDYLKDNGIIHQLTTAYTLQQNGVAERRNRMLIDSIRCLLKHWTVNWILDRRNTVRNLHEEQSSQQVNKWKKPHTSCGIIQNLATTISEHSFVKRGTRPQTKTPKLEPKGIPCIMLGYSSESKAYIVYDVRKNTHITSRNIIINEELFPGIQDKPAYIH